MPVRLTVVDGEIVLPRPLGSPGCPRPDIAIVGGGILGLAVARELARRDAGRRVVVLEREDRLALHQTGHNSGVAHAGIYYAPGSLKARLCVAGVRELAEYCDARGIPYERCGKVIVALDESELPGLDELQRRGEANGVPGLRRLDAAGLREIEPHAAGIAALHSPNDGDRRLPRRRPRARRRRARGRRRDPLRRGRDGDRGPRGVERHAAGARVVLRHAGGSSTPASRCSAPARGRTGSRAWPAPTPTRASSRSAAPTCACARARRRSCAG